MTSTGKAIVAYEPTADAPTHTNWKMEDVKVTEPKEDEVLVKMVATGVCHTDIVLSTVPNGAMGIFYPKICGHEGSGYVAAKGSQVTSVEVGDPVLLSFASCSACTQCKTSHPGFCDSFNQRNYIGEEARMTISGDKPVYGSFFGQSSFSSMSCVKESSIVNVKDLIKNEDELKLFAPLGCGIQTGAGTLLRLGQADPESRVVILGLGGVGLSAVMAAKMAGCKTIIGVDRHVSRLELARTLGATETINTTNSAEIKDEIFRLTGGDGASITIDTTGFPALIKEGFEFTGSKGKLIFVGVPPFDFSMDFNLVGFLGSGKSLIASIEGDVVPQQFIPEMIKWYREGKFPFDKFVQMNKASDFQKSLESMHTGETIKPVLIW